MLILICGNLGYGKTLLATILGKFASESTSVISNYHLGYKYIPFSLFDYVSSKYSNSLVLIDEIYGLLDARLSMSKKNLLLSYIFLQSRKKELDIIGTLQLIQTLDLRYRRMAELIIFSEGIVEIENKLYFKYTFYRKGFIPKTKYLLYESCKPFFKLYDTKEVVKPDIQNNLINHFKSHPEKLNDVDKISELIMNYYNGLKITQNRVDTFIFKNELDLNLKKYVYQNIKDIEEMKESGIIPIVKKRKRGRPKKNE